jgi:uncharacterized membrane protein
MTDGAEKFMVSGIVVCLAITAVLNFGPLLGVSNVTNAIVTMLCALVFTLLHGALAFGWGRLAIFVALAVVVSFISEVIGVATGWIFGNYHYTDNFGPKILGVPPITQAGYVSMGYASLIIARVILDRLRTPKGWGILAVPICATFVMVSWDVAMDPYQSTVSGDWIWRDGGPYFGVPLHNYVGWFGTVFVLTLVYMAYERVNPLPKPSGLAARRWFWSLPVVNYALIAVGIVLVPFVGGLDGRIAVSQNYAGSPSELQYSMSLVATFVMGTPVVLALSRLMLKEPETNRE